MKCDNDNIEIPRHSNNTPSYADDIIILYPGFHGFNNYTNNIYLKSNYPMYIEVRVQWTI